MVLSLSAMCFAIHHQKSIFVRNDAVTGILRGPDITCIVHAVQHPNDLNAEQAVLASIHC